MSSFVLKIIGILSMLCDHSGYVIFGKFSFLNYIGRLAFPIFAFQLTEGYIHTKNIKKYIVRLFIFALISQIPYSLYRIFVLNTNVNLNILFTLLLGLIAILIYDKIQYKIIGIISFIFIAIGSEFSGIIDYGWFGITIIFIFYILKENKISMNLFFVISVFLNSLFCYIKNPLPEYLLVSIYYIIALIIINLYNEKKGKSAKYLFYLFYPIHFFILYLINIFIK